MTHRTGDRIGDYTLVEELGSGGNADVWRATSKDGEQVALKILRTTKPHREKYRRFEREVREHHRLSQEGFPGILPLLNYHLPEEPASDNPAWLVMPVAIELTRALGKRPSLEQVVSAVATISDTLARLHEKGIAHRDVKPGNFYRYRDEWVISDFGLIETQADDETSLTVGAQALGPRNFIAPEMLVRPDKADGQRADVYSLGKTLWALAAGIPIPPSGEHRPEFKKGLREFGVVHPRAFYLDRLIDQMTREPPEERPCMTDVAKALRTWASPPRNRDPVPLRDNVTAHAIADLQQKDERMMDRQRARNETVERAVKDLSRSMPEIVEYLNSTGVSHSGMTPDPAGVGQVFGAEISTIADAEAVSWRSCRVSKKLGVGSSLQLTFGVGAVLTRANLVIMMSAYHLAGPKASPTIWSDSDRALLDSPDYEEKVNRLADGLVRHLGQGLQTLLEASQENET